MTTFGFDTKTRGLIVKVRLPLDLLSMSILNVTLEEYEVAEIRKEGNFLCLYNSDAKEA